ncbi:MAG: MEDS domain-containing protein [Candidatus Binataceae bacterium]
MQFYEDPAFVIESVAYLAADALNVGDSSILIATSSHLSGIRDRLTGYGLDLKKLHTSGRYVSLDAEETLSRLMANDWPNDSEFSEIIGGVIRNAMEKSANHFAFVFGEMVAVLCAANKAKAVVRLEQLWNSLAETYRFSLCCAYPLSSVVDQSELNVVFQICAEHSLVIPAETFSASA